MEQQSSTAGAAAAAAAAAEKNDIPRLLVERDMKQYIQLLQQELERRCNEAVVSAARLREVESQLAEIHSSEKTEPSPSPPPLQQQQQLEDEPEPEYKSKTKGHCRTFSSCTL